MKTKLDLIQKLPTFRKITIQGLETMMDCFCGEFIYLNKGENLYGDNKKAVCIIQGEIENSTQGRFFPMPKKEKPCSVMEDSLVLVLDSHMLLYPCYGCCFFHAQLLENIREDGIDLKSLES